MKKILSILAILFIAFVLLVAGGIYYGLSKIDDVVKMAIEEYAPLVTQTPVTVGSVDISILEGSAGLSNLVVANPEGYNQPNVFSLDEISVSVDYDSLENESGVLVISQILIAAPKVFVEQNLQKNNLKDLLDNVNSFVASVSSGSSSAEEESVSDPAQDVFLAVNEIVFKEGLLQGNIQGNEAIEAATGVGDQELSLPLPSFTLNNLGTPSAGLTPAELASEILSALLGQAMQVAQEAGKDVLLDKGKELIEEKLQEGLLEKIPVPEGTGMDAEGVKEAVKGLGDLLGR